MKHDGGVCKVKARMTPEHNVRKKAYGVTLECNESNGKLVSVQCDGCVLIKADASMPLLFYSGCTENALNPPRQKLNAIGESPVCRV